MRSELGDAPLSAVLPDYYPCAQPHGWLEELKRLERADAELATLKSQLRPLVAKWREDAAGGPHHYGVAGTLEDCADELEAVLGAKP